MDKNENKGLKPYESPSTKKTQVKLEEGVCAGSVDMNANSPHGIDTQAQDVNADFTNENNFKDGTWDN